jgi:hypothetical protein
LSYNPTGRTDERRIVLQFRETVLKLVSTLARNTA